MNEGKPQHSIWLWILWAIAVAIGALGVAFLLVGVTYGVGLWPWNNPEEKRPALDEAARSTVLLLGVVAAAVAGAVTIRRQASTERAHDLEQRRVELDETARLRERYTSAAEQLGSETSAIRLAGAYAMAALADEWVSRDRPADAQVCIDILCGYLRSSHPKASADGLGMDIEVRESIARMIARRLSGEELREPGPWSDFEFDFTGAHLRGTYDFSRSYFGGRVLFRRCTVEGTLALTAISCEDTSMSLDGMTLTSGRLDLSRALLRNCRLFFDGVTVEEGFVHLRNMRLEGSEMHVVGSKFMPGSRLQILRSHFDEDSLIDFDHTTFGGSFRVADNTFAGPGALLFRRCRDEGGVVSGPWARPGLPDSWPQPQGEGAS